MITSLLMIWLLKSKWVKDNDVILIRLKCIYNFWCSMLVYAPFALCFVTLRGVFMHFPELTYWWDATVPVPCFLLFLCFKKVTQEIFSELDETKPKPPIFPDTRRSPKESRRGARGWCGDPAYHCILYYASRWYNTCGTSLHKYYIPQNGTTETLWAQIQTDPHFITDQSVMITKCPP
jgi:hypothetical protein